MAFFLPAFDKTIQIDARSPLHYPSTVFPPPTVHALDYKHVRNERETGYS